MKELYKHTQLLPIVHIIGAVLTRLDQNRRPLPRRERCTDRGIGDGRFKLSKNETLNFSRQQFSPMVAAGVKRQRESETRHR